MYYPQGGRNWAAIIAGLAAVGIGAYAVYWLWQNGYFDKSCDTTADCDTGYVCSNHRCVKEETKRCSNYGSSDCVNNPDGLTCYLCNGSCQSTPCGEVPCVRGMPSANCYANHTGLKQCDYYDNLCECNGTKWNLLEAEAGVCVNNISHLECFPNSDNLATCVPQFEAGADQCEASLPYGCPCSSTIGCGDYGFCDQTVHRCMRKAYQVPVSANSTNWQWCGSDEIWDCSGIGSYTGNSCIYELAEEYGASNLSGTLGYKDSFWQAGVHTRIYGGLSGGGFTLLGQLPQVQAPGQTGEITFNLNFTTQGLQLIKFAMCSPLNIGTKPSYFNGHLNY